MNRILVLSTYSIKNPTGGGQKRVAAIVQQYRAAGNNVEHAAIYLDTANTGADQNDMAVPWTKYNKNPLAYVIGDLLLSDSLDEESDVRTKFIALIKDFKPTVVQIEQTFLYKTVKNVLDDLGWSGVMVNSTHNIESLLKKDILESSTNLDDAEINTYVSAIDDIEKFAARDADFTIACTESDSKELKRFGAKDVVVAPNGISLGKVNKEDAAKVKDTYKKKGVDKLILYVGSAHPPNLTGYAELIGGKVGFMGENTRLLAVGGVSNLIFDYTQTLPNYIRPIFNERVELLGMVSEQRLASLLYLADQIILPITEGGGSNLKTAEAILSDTSIVATTKSFRSYESYLSLPNIIIADNGEDFRKAMADSLSQPKKARTDKQKQLASGVEWSNTLKKMVERLT